MSTSSSSRRALMGCVASISLLTAVSGQAQAQTTTETAAAGPSALAEVVVTARKQNETLVKAPLSVSVLSGQDLQARGITSYATLQSFTPGFKFINQSVNKNDRGYTSFMMRGMNPGTPVAYQQDVSIFIDGSPVAGGVVSGLNDVEQVEVIKGPQSAYFGRASFAGAVNFITRAPGFVPKAKVDASYSSYNTYDVTAEAEGPIIGDMLAGRLALRDYHTDGQYANPEMPGQRLGEQGTKSVSGDLLFKPTSKLTVRAFGKYWKDDDGPGAQAYLYPSQYNCNATQAGYTVSGLQFVNGKNYFCGKLPKFTTAGLSQTTSVPSAYYGVFNGKTPALFSGVYRKALVANHQDNDHFGLQRTGMAFSASAHYDFDNGFAINAQVGHHENVWGFISDLSAKNLLNTPNPNYGSTSASFNATNVPGGLRPYSAAFGRGDLADRDTSAEIRLSSPDDKRLKGMIGYSYFHQHSQLALTSYTNAGFNQSSAPQQQLADTPAVFGNASYKILDNLDINAEGRLQWDTIQAKVPATNVAFRKTFRSFSPRVILSYHPTEASTLYISYAKGTRPGVFNNSFAALPAASKAAILAVTNVDLAVPEEDVSMYEVGYKTRFLDNRAQFVSAIYWGDWTGRHILNKVYYLDNTNTLQNTLFTIAGGETELYGVELEGRFQATPSLLIEGTFDYAGTKIKKDYCADCLLITGNAYPTGTHMPGSPLYTATLSGTYTHPAFANFDGYLRIDYLYTGTIYIDDANVAETGASNKLNLRAGINNGRYRIEVFGNNVTNDDTYSYGQRYSDGLPAGGSGIAASPPVNEVSVGAPDKATYGIHIVASF